MYARRRGPLMTLPPCRQLSLGSSHQRGTWRFLVWDLFPPSLFVICVRAHQLQLFSTFPPCLLISLISIFTLSLALNLPTSQRLMSTM